MSENPEIGKSVVAAGIKTNYLEQGSGPPVVLIHGSGPGVTAYANWRLVIPKLSPKFRVIAPDIVGFGYTDRPRDARYTMDYWLRHMVGFLDALGIDKASVVGNSFGGGLSVALAINHPQRVDKMVLMGAAGVSFKLTPGLDAVWGYEPSIDNMRKIVQLFAWNKALLTEDLVKLRYEASVRPGYQESYASMFPAPRQRHVEAMANPDDKVRAIPHETLVVHGRDDQVVPLETSLKLSNLIPRSQLHVFGQTGHWTQIERNKDFCRLVESFLSNE
jgi:2-hydroxymuconate-semialdehyde hydrolase